MNLPGENLLDSTFMLLKLGLGFGFEFASLARFVSGIRIPEKRIFDKLSHDRGTVLWGEIFYIHKKKVKLRSKTTSLEKKIKFVENWKFWNININKFKISFSKYRGEKGSPVFLGDFLPIPSSDSPKFWVSWRFWLS